MAHGSTLIAERALSVECLRRENLAFVGTPGVSAANQAFGFVPAFADSDTGRIEIARYANGRPAPMHLLDGLPLEWVVSRGADGRINAVKSSIIAGFFHAGRFYTREQAAALG